MNKKIVGIFAAVAVVALIVVVATSGPKDSAPAGDAATVPADSAANAPDSLQFPDALLEE